MPLEKKIFSRFYMLSRLVTIRQMRAQSKFRQMWGNFSHLPENRGPGEESNHEICENYTIPPPQLYVAYPRADHSPAVVRTKG